MKKQTREPLTKQMYKDKLKHKLIYELLAFCFTMFGWLLLFLITSIGLYSLLVYRFPVLAVIVALVTIAPITFCYLHEIYRMFYGLYMIGKDRLIVREDTLVGIADHEVALNILEGARRIRFIYVHNFFTHVNAFYFAQYDRYVLTNEKAMFQSSACGDTFYIVMYDDGRDRPAVVYNTKIYELKE